MGLLYLSSYIKERFDDINIELLDMQALDLPSDAERRRCEEVECHRFFLILPQQVDDAYELSRFARPTQRSLIITRWGPPDAVAR